MCVYKENKRSGYRRKRKEKKTCSEVEKKKEMKKNEGPFLYKMLNLTSSEVV